MKKIVFLLLAAIITIGFSSCSKDEEKEGRFLFLLKDQNGKGLEGYINIYPKGEYDPKTYSPESITIKTTNGESVFVSYAVKTEQFKAVELECEEGDYYAVAYYIKSEKSSYGGLPTLINVWKGEPISIKGGEEKKLTFTLDLTKKNGCQN